MRGARDPGFIDDISQAFISLVCTAIWFILRSWKTGIYVEGLNFNPHQNPDIMSKAHQAL